MLETGFRAHNMTTEGYFHDQTFKVADKTVTAEYQHIKIQDKISFSRLTATSLNMHPYCLYLCRFQRKHNVFTVHENPLSYIHMNYTE